MTPQTQAPVEWDFEAELEKALDSIELFESNLADDSFSDEKPKVCYS